MLLFISFFIFTFAFYFFSVCLAWVVVPMWKRGQGRVDGMGQ